MRKIRGPKRIVKGECFVDTKQGRIPLSLTRSSARRTLTITVDECAQASIAAPFRMADQEIANFLLEKADWICKKVQEAQKTRNILDQKSYTISAKSFNEKGPWCFCLVNRVFSGFG